MLDFRVARGAGGGRRRCAADYHNGCWLFINRLATTTTATANALRSCECGTHFFSPMKGRQEWTDGRMDGRALFSGRGGNFGCGRRRTASDETTLIEIGWARRNTSKDFEREGTAETETENAKSGRTDDGK